MQTQACISISISISISNLVTIRFPTLCPASRTTTLGKAIPLIVETAYNVYIALLELLLLLLSDTLPRCPYGIPLAATRKMMGVCDLPLMLPICLLSDRPVV